MKKPLSKEEAEMVKQRFAELWNKKKPSV